MILSLRDLWGAVAREAAETDPLLLQWLGEKPAAKPHLSNAAEAIDLLSRAMSEIGEAPDIRELDRGYLLGPEVFRIYQAEFRRLDSEMERAVELMDSKSREDREEFWEIRGDWLSRVEELQDEYNRLANTGTPNGIADSVYFAQRRPITPRRSPETPLEYFRAVTADRKKTDADKIARAFTVWSQAVKDTIKRPLDLLAPDPNYSFFGSNLLFLWRPEQFEVAGVRVVVEQAAPKATTRYAADAIRNAADAIRKAGLGASLRDLVVQMYPQKYEGDWFGGACAYYQRETGNVILSHGFFSTCRGWDAAGVGTIIHEVGHRFYYMLVNNHALKSWEAQVSERQLKFSPEDVKRAGGLITSYVKSVGADYYDLPNEERGLAADAYVAKHPVPDERKQAANRAILRLVAGWGRGVQGKSAQGVIDAVVQAANTPAASFMVEPTDKGRTDDYGATNPAEAFAEVFKLYVLHGPRAVGPWTRALFRAIVRDGGGAPLKNPAPGHAGPKRRRGM